MMEQPPRAWAMEAVILVVGTLMAGLLTWVGSSLVTLNSRVDTIQAILTRVDDYATRKYEQLEQRLRALEQAK